MKQLTLFGLLLLCLVTSAQTIGNRFKNPKVLIKDSFNTVYGYPWGRWTGEPGLLVQNDSLYCYFTADTDGGHCSVGLATGTHPDSLVVLPEPVVAQGRGGTPSNRIANCNYPFRYNGYIYLLGTDGMGASGGETRDLYLYRSTDGRNFSDLGKLLPHSDIPGASGFGNVAILPVLVGGYYHMFAEGAVNGTWKIYHFKSTAIESGWTYDNEVSSLQVATGGTYGGTTFIYLNGTVHIFYHYTPNSGVLPTYLGYATTLDFVSYDRREAPFKAIDIKPWGTHTDQIADAMPIEYRGKTYLAATLNWNGPSDGEYHHAEAWYWTFNGTMEELLYGPKGPSFYGRLTK